MSSDCLILIPARMASTRLPNKPLAMIGDRPMIVHVADRAAAAGVGAVVVAAAEAEIVAAVEAAGHRAVLTDPDLPSGSDRIWAALTRIDPHGRAEIVVNVQGDLPTLDPALVARAAALAREPGVDIATLVTPIREAWERDAPQVVKAAIDLPVPPIGGATTGATGAAAIDHGRALYFSRRAIPSGDGPLYHHIGLYAYRRAALAAFVAAPPSPLERREALEQLRALSLGLRIEAAVVDTAPLGVDTPDDLTRARERLAPGGANG